MADHTQQSEMDKQDETAMVETQPAGDKQTEMVTLSKAEYEKIQKALKDANREAEKRRKELDDKAKAEMTEVERLKAELESERAERLSAIREAVKVKYNLPDVLSKRLAGTTREEIEADAAELAESLPKPAPKSPGPVGGNPPTKATLTIAQIKQMSTEEINKNWEAVQEVLKKSREE